MAVAAAALASVSSAVILSTLGASGTLIGAAVGSVVATITSAMYTRGLQTSKEKVAVVFQSGGVSRVSAGEASRLAEEGELADAEVSEAVLGADAEGTAEAGERRTLGERFAAIDWRRVGPWAIGTFVVVMAAITAFELIGGKPVSSLTGGTDGTGTSIGRVVDRDGGQRKDRDRQPPSERPSESEPTPTDEPSDAPSDSPESPSAESTDESSEQPSDSATPAPTPPVPAQPEATTPSLPAEPPQP